MQHQRVNRPERRHVNHPERQRVNQAEHQHVNRPEYQQINHLLYASKTHHRIPVNLLDPIHVNHRIIRNNPNVARTEHPVIVVVLVEAVPEGAVVLAGEGLEAAEVEDANNRFIYI